MTGESQPRTWGMFWELGSCCVSLFADCWTKGIRKEESEDFEYLVFVALKVSRGRLVEGQLAACSGSSSWTAGIRWFSWRSWLVHGPWYRDFRYVYFVKEVVVDCGSVWKGRRPLDWLRGRAPGTFVGGPAFQLRSSS